MRKNLRIGSILRVPLTTGKFGYVRYVAQNDRRGPLIQVLDIITGEAADIGSLERVGTRFRPFLANIALGLAKHGWAVIGYEPVRDFQWPAFINGHYDDVRRRVHTWFLVDSEGDHLLGPELPPEYRDLEFEVIWPPEQVEHRIRTGEIPDPWWFGSADNEGISQKT